MRPTTRDCCSSLGAFSPETGQAGESAAPQGRQGRFRSEIFERHQRSEKALASAVAEICGEGLSPRKERAITAEPCRQEFCQPTIRGMVGQLDEEVEQFARGLEEAA